MAEEIKVGIIGFGKMGKIRKDLIDNSSSLQLQAVCDPHPETNENSLDCPFFSDYHELLERDIDAVFIATPNKYTPNIVIDSLKKKKHVFCEKPPGRSIDDVKRIIAVEQSVPDRKLKFGFNHRYHDSIMEADAIVRSGRLGKILWIRGIYGKSGGVGFEQQWRSNPTIAGGGILLDQGIHMIDLCRMFCGDFDEVKSLVTNSHWNLDVENDAFALLRNKKNQIAMIHSSSTQWKHKFSLEISLDEGYINLYGILSSTRSYGQGEQLVYAKKQFEDESFAIGNPQENVTYFSHDRSWEREVEDFVRCIKEDRAVQTGSSHDALKAMELVNQIYNADQKWKKVKAIS